MSFSARSLRPPLGVGQPTGRLVTGGLVATLIGACVFAVALAVPSPSPVMAVAVSFVAALALWMFVTPRTDVALIVFMLYLGLVDGYIKLRTGSSVVTPVRDVLLYAIVAGVLARKVLRGERLTFPPLSAWVGAFVLVALVQLFNPNGGNLVHSLGGLRPQIEFVPLFFFGYTTMRSARRLRIFFLVLLVIGAANGIVSYAQFNLTPAELAAWGPGYQKRVYGGANSVSGRTFTDASGQVHVRPFGLGSDSGVGGYFGLIALPAALALIALARRRLAGRIAAPLAVASLLAVASSQGRTVVVAAVAAVFAFVALSVAARRLVQALAGLAGTLLLMVAVVAIIGGSSTRSFDRYRTITPGKLVSTSDKNRGSSLAKVPKYLRKYPLGAGLGSVGPATGFANTSATAKTGPKRDVDGETEPTFLLTELGIPGLVVLTGFLVTLISLAVRRTRRIADPELRALLSAFGATLIALFLTWLSTESTAIAPAGPYVWFTGGVLAYWLASHRDGTLQPELGSDGAVRAGA